MLHPSYILSSSYHHHNHPPPTHPHLRRCLHRCHRHHHHPFIHFPSSPLYTRNVFVYPPCLHSCILELLSYRSGRKNLHGAVDGAEAFLRKGNHAVKYVILLTKGRQDREPEAETLLSKIDAQNLVVFFNDVRDSNEASGFVLLRSSSDLESNVDEISRRVMAAYGKLLSDFSCD